MFQRDAIESQTGEIRLFAYCHEGMGVGHLRRTLTICNRLAQAFPGLKRRIATGSPYASLFESHREVGWVKLPTIAKLTTGAYRPATPGVELGALLEARRQLLVGAVERWRPHILLVDKAPVGVCGELEPALRRVRAHLPRTRVVFGMRDIDDAPETTRREWSALGAWRALEECYDEIWVYGMREVFDVARMYQMPEGIESKLRYVGYVCEEPGGNRDRDASSTEDIVVTVGGGTDGDGLIRAYLDHAAPQAASRGLRSTIVAGPDLPTESSSSLRRLAAGIPGVTWISADTSLRERFVGARLVVSMGGYNTLCEVVAQGRRSLVVPRVSPRVEQLLRATLWHQRGVVEMLHPRDLTPQTLSDRVMKLIEVDGPCSRDGLDLRGLETIVHRFGQIREEASRYEAAVRLQ